MRKNELGADATGALQNYEVFNMFTTLYEGLTAQLAATDDF